MEESGPLIATLTALGWAAGKFIVVFLGVVGGMATLESSLFSVNFRNSLSQVINYKNYENNSVESGPPKNVAQVLSSCTNYFDWLFGKHHWTIRCMSVSVVFTMLFATISFMAIIFILDKEEFEVFYGFILNKKNAFILVIALIWNLIIDFISLWETRRVIGIIRNDGSWFGVLLLLIADILFTYGIFIFLVSVLKFSIDMYYIIPLIYRHEVISIRSVIGIDVTLSAMNGLIVNAALFFWFALQIAFFSTLDVLKDLGSNYWTMTLYIEGKSPYIIPASTLWATTHLSTLFIIVYIAFWAAAKHLTIFKAVRLPKHFMPTKIPVFLAQFDPVNQPVTVLVFNGMIWGGTIYILSAVW